MIYLYDRALCEDLRQSFNPDALSNPVVRVVEPDAIVGLAAQLQNDNIQFPLVAVGRDSDTSIDVNRTNFTYIHKGVSTVLDPKTNLWYYEKVVPINLGYHLTILTTNTADMDEMVRELLFKYTSMYFITMTLPYECERKIRFGVEIDTSASIERRSGQLEYIQNGQLYQTILSLKCQGAVLVTYTPVKLKRMMPQSTTLHIDK